jgi:hypothetical protein
MDRISVRSWVSCEKYGQLRIFAVELRLYHGKLNYKKREGFPPLIHPQQHTYTTIHNQSIVTSPTLVLPSKASTSLSWLLLSGLSLVPHLVLALRW